MKKLLAVILASLCLVSCSNTHVSTVQIGDPEVYWCDGLRSSRTDGLYYYQDFSYKGGSKNTLCYADYSNCTTVVVCPKPNCPHTDPDSCYALGVTNGNCAVLPHGDSIYWLFVDNEGTTVYRAKADGTERRKVCDIEERSAFGGTLCAVGEKMYFIAEDELEIIYGDDGKLTQAPRSAYFYAYDFASGKAEELYDFKDLFPKAERFVYGISGVWKGGIYMNVVAMTGEASGSHHIVKYDISLNTLEISEIEPWQISGEYMILRERGGLLVMHDSGEEYFFERLSANIMLGAKVINGYLFIDGTVVELETGKRYENLCDVIPGPQAYIDGKYLIYDWNSLTFNMVSESKVIGDEKK